MLSGVLITRYLAALARLVGAGVTMRLQLGCSVGDPPVEPSGNMRVHSA